nr:ABC transporter permease [Aurantimonas marianensis]
MSSLALRNLTARKGRTAATIAGVLLSVASFVALVGLARGIEQSLLAALEARQTDVIVTEAGALDLISSIVPETLADDLARAPGVVATAPEMSRVTTLGSGESAIVVAWPVGSYPWRSLDMIAGRLPGAQDGRSAVIGTSLAERLGAGVGDRLEVFQAEFAVVGIAGSASVLTRNLVFIPLPVAQTLMFREGQATSINVRLDQEASPQERQRLALDLKAAFPNYAVEETENLVDSHTFARIADVVSTTISIIALATAVLAILNTMTMAVNERRGEIAIMSAVGWPRRRIVASIVLEGVVLAALGGVLGSAVGVAAARLVSALPVVAGLVVPEINLALVTLAALVSLAIGLVGSLLPALRAASSPPADVLRGR